MAIDKILVFNRGEIACRVIRTAAALGYRSVAVFTEGEGAPLHADMADEAVLIGADRRSYLDPAAAIRAARMTGADALHPGYGFLSESAALAQACAEAGITFIGPCAAAIEAMGDKAAARRLMEAAGVPCVPGYHGAAQDDDALRGAAERIGWPLMVKAAAGGGGKGLRRVDDASAFAAAVRAARSEGLAAFGSDTLILERALTRVRHVEVQVFADSHGNAIHLGERDCSVQRRHQKVIEETPCPVLGPDLRAQLGQAAVRAAEAIHYRGAGTVEFLLEPDGRFWFLEMNTRLQVEHAITEAVTGLDLVAWQIRVASGERLPLRQEEVVFSGGAIEARIYAETPDLRFLPRTGRIAAVALPAGEGLRIDHALKVGAEVSADYDPLLAKVIAHGATREEARRRLVRALEGLLVGGVETNRAFLLRALGDEAFVRGEVSTAFVAERQQGLEPPPLSSAEVALANLLLDRDNAGGVPRRARRNLRIGDERRLVLTARDEGGAGWAMAQEDGPGHVIALEGGQGCEVRYRIDGVRKKALAVQDGARLHIALPQRDLFVTAADGTGPDADVQPRSPMTGKLVALHVAPGQRVEAGATIAVVEAMKMEQDIKASGAGEVAAVLASPGQAVAQGDLLIRIEFDDA